MYLIGVSVALCVVFGTIAYKIRKRKNPSLTVKSFLGLDARRFLTAEGMKLSIVAMVSGMVFGTIDNAGLWFGMSALDPYFSKRWGVTSGNVLAGLGNTYSDALGAFLGTFVGMIVTDATNVDISDAPIWADAIGVTLGCLLGIYIGKTATANA